MTVQRRAFQPQAGEDFKDSSTDSNGTTKQRQQQNQHEERKDEEKEKKKEKEKEKEKEKSRRKRDLQEGGHATAAAGSTFSIYSVFRLALGCLITSCALSYFVTGDSLFWGHRPWYTRVDNLRAWISGPIVLTDTELAAYDGSDPSKPVYLALDGQIYDVSAGRHFYGPGGSYHFFAGRDAARAFVTGCFQDDLTPDLRGVEEMYIPLRDDESSVGEEGEKIRQEPDRIPKTEKEARRQEKIAREREHRQAKKRVRSVIDGWAKTFRGDTGKPYFWVGRVEREEGWLEKLPFRNLCEAAKKSRPKINSHA